MVTSPPIHRLAGLQESLLGNPLASIGPTAARKEQDLVPGLATRIKIETGLRQSANDEHGVAATDVFPRRDDIPALPVSRPAVSDLDRGQVGAKVARKLVNEETFSV